MANIAESTSDNLPRGKFSFYDNSSDMNNRYCLIDFHGVENSGHCLMRFRMEPGDAEQFLDWDGRDSLQ
jgi:hypothetical protein